ncbi:LytTR family DNA-binding domain-containing protein [bacterium]|nr:LytTR family DNA-binding domain-containing protein [bacterium]
MKILIIEDEYPAAEKLQHVLREADPSMEILAVLDSVESGLRWMNTNKSPDLIFSDIQLSDGLSFEIFENFPTDCPVIFTTAYDEYAIRAFRVKSIDYLLKPIKTEKVKAALKKYRSFVGMKPPGENQMKLNEVIQILEQQKTQYKTRFLIRFRDQLLPVPTEEIAYFFTENEVTYLCKNNGEKYTVDHKLEKLEGWLNPEYFFRANRQFLCRLPAIRSIHPYFNGRLKLVLVPEGPKEVIVSRDKAKTFKQWLGE